ncbi:hypothetical protein N7453_001220 [Penicillium expansum]|nr:hypothetical protein N7453_001220 [Penicillium expansum]
MAPTFIDISGHMPAYPPATATAGEQLNHDKISRYERFISSLDLEQFRLDKLEKRLLTVSANALGPVAIPIYVYRSSIPGPTIGITSAIHGNEVNGVAVIQQMFDRLENACAEAEENPVVGTIFGIPVLNVPGFLNSVRSFDGQDLNRLMPGKVDGAAPQQYAYQLFHEVISKFDYVFDLHTASAGRQNSLYVRADMTYPEVSQMAQRLGSQIIVHNSSPGGSLRGCAQAKGIKAITIEIGNPSIFQDDLITKVISGIGNALTVPFGHPLFQVCGLKFPEITPTICYKSYWVFSKTAGILRVYKKVADSPRRGDLIAEIRSIFGEVIEQVYSPIDLDTVVVGIEANPVAKTGNRIIHLGVIGDDFQQDVCDGHL